MSCDIDNGFDTDDDLYPRSINLVEVGDYFIEYPSDIKGFYCIFRDNVQVRFLIHGGEIYYFSSDIGYLFRRSNVNGNHMAIKIPYKCKSGSKVCVSHTNLVNAIVRRRHRGIPTLRYRVRPLDLSKFKYEPLFNFDPASV